MGWLGNNKGSVVSGLFFSGLSLVHLDQLNQGAKDLLILLRILPTLFAVFFSLHVVWGHQHVAYAVSVAHHVRTRPVLELCTLYSYCSE